MRNKETVKIDDIDLHRAITLKQFAELVGVLPKDIGMLKRFKILSAGGSAGEWLVQWDCFQSGVIVGRKGWDGLAKRQEEAERGVAKTKRSKRRV